MNKIDFKRIAELREIKGIKKSELAKLIGVSAAYITQLENGKKNNPSLDLINKIANVLNCSTSDLIDNNNIQVATMDFKVEEILKDKYIVEIDITENRVHISDNKAINVTLTINEFNILKNNIIMDINNKIQFIQELKEGE